MKIIVDNAIPFIEGRILGDCDIVRLPASIIDKDVVRHADALVVRTRTKCNETLLAGSDVKLIASATIGLDHIDTEWCENNGIVVHNAPGCNAPGVAQYVLSALLKSGFNPEKETLGVIGFGNVGQIVTKWAREIGIKTFVSDAPREADGLKDEEYLPMNEILRNCEAVTLHVPFSSKGPFPTEYLIGERQFDLMKPGAILVNSSRGGIVNEIAWKNKIKRGEVKAIVDVWENEPNIDSELASLALIATPHIAGYSEEGKKRATGMVLEALSDVLKIPVDAGGLLPKTPSCGPDDLKDRILESYSPEIDSLRLKTDVSSFENLRNSYHYRHEPHFFNL